MHSNEKDGFGRADFVITNGYIAIQQKPLATNGSIFSVRKYKSTLPIKERIQFANKLGYDVRGVTMQLKTKKSQLSSAARYSKNKNTSQ